MSEADVAFAFILNILAIKTSLVTVIPFSEYRRFFGSHKNGSAVYIVDLKE